jgi:putative ATP-dependent endonuclease of OLD family
MKLTELRIENFRSFLDETVRLDDYTCLVGPNGSGKSAILMALNIFFRENASTSTDVLVLGEEDFHHRDTKRPVKITLTFECLSEEAQKDLEHYYRQGKLIVSAEAAWDNATNSAPVKQYGSRTVMKDFSPFFKADEEKAKVGELREIYEKIRTKYPKLPVETTKSGMTNALRSHEESHPELCELIPAETQFYGWTRGRNLMDKYIQWIYIPAVKDASMEQEENAKTALGKLLARTVRTRIDFTESLEDLKKDAQEKYTNILEEHKESLKELQMSIEKRLQDYSDSRSRLQLRWHYDAKESISIRDPAARADIGDGDFMGEIARAGHGLQRIFLVTILHELVGNDQKGGPKLLLGIEEPELYQHPPQAQHLADVLERLSRPENNSQVILTTHSPHFVSSKAFEHVRMVRKAEGQRISKVSQMTYEKLSERLGCALSEEPAPINNLMARIGQIMLPSQNELFFTSVAVIVEGLEDLAYISTQLGISGQLSELRKLGCHFIIAGSKRNLSRLIAIALEFKIPFFAIFDADGDDTDTNNRNQNEKDNLCISNLCKIKDIEAFPEDIFWGENIVIWPTKIKKVVKADFDENIYNDAENTVRSQYNLFAGIRDKNQMLIAYTLNRLNDQSNQSKSLIKLCGNILRYASKVQTRS